MAVYCQSIQSIENQSDCVKLGEPVKILYPDANVPALNYPSLVVKAFAIFSDYSEDFFLRFWKINAYAMIGAIFLLSWSYNFKAFPLLIFNPITLLAIERGNTDAIVFSLIFIPFLFFKNSDFFRMLFLGIATSLKIFPVFMYAIYAQFRRFDSVWGTVLAFLISAPFVIYSFLELPQIFFGYT
jgi:hypothetical protein